MKIAELQKTTVECQRTTETLTQKLEKQDTASIRLQENAESAKDQAASTAKTYAETLERLQDLQVLQDKAEKRQDILDCNIQELESEKLVLGNKLRVMSHQSAETEARLSSLEEKISTLTDALNKANERTREAEYTFEELSVVLAALEEEANDLKTKSTKMREQLDIIRANMSDD